MKMLQEQVAPLFRELRLARSVQLAGRGPGGRRLVDDFGRVDV